MRFPARLERVAHEATAHIVGVHPNFFLKRHSGSFGSARIATVFINAMSNTYIALTGLASHWGTHNNTLPLTDGCRIRGGEEFWRSYGDPVDMTRFHGLGEVVAAQAICNRYALACLPILADTLEARLKLGYEQRFYERIITPWLVWFVQAAYDRYNSVRKASSIPGVCFLTGQGKVHPRSSASDHHNDAASNDSYNLRFYSDIVRALGLAEETLPVDDARHYSSYLFGDSITRVFTKAALRTCLLAFERLFSRSTHLCYDVYGLPPLRDICNYNRGLLPMSHNIKLDLLLDEQFRAKPLSGLGHDDFSHILSVLIPRYLPVGLCEAVPHFVRWAKLQSLPQKGVIATSVGLYTDPAVMVLAGVRQRPLAIIEHGGNGMLHQSDPHLFTQKITADRYYSMGQDQFALPSPYLASRGIRKKVSPPLLVTNDGCRFLSRIMPTVCEGSMVPYHERRKSFLRSLPAELFPQIRLYYTEYGWGVRENTLQSFPNIQIQESSQIPITQALSDACLLILDHYSTSLHRALSTNTPTIIFTPPNGFSAEAEEVIVHMRSVGIWHDTPEGAARFYTSLVEKNAGNWVAIEKNVKDWWLNKNVQSARNLFCDKFAKTSPTWSSEWLSAFDALAEA